MTNESNQQEWESHVKKSKKYLDIWFGERRQPNKSKRRAISVTSAVLVVGGPPKVTALVMRRLGYRLEWVKE